jgi:hypothetical protein
MQVRVFGRQYVLKSATNQTLMSCISVNISQLLQIFNQYQQNWDDTGSVTIAFGLC